ncbi:MAG: TIGR03621 family F420-dependent LLM class oxidoreductase [Roseiflexaceae bacterium]
MSRRPFRFGVVTGQSRSAEEWIAKARRAESLGFSSFLVPDTLGQTFAPLPALAIAAAATHAIHVGTYVLANDFRNPVLVARESATLDFLSGGRFELGLGVGRPGVEEDCRKLGISFDSGGVRVERLAEALGIIKAILSGQATDAPGPHYAAVGADVFPRPAQQPRPPILVAASGKRLLALAAREADIVALAVPPLEGHAALKEKIDWLRESAGDRFLQLELNSNLTAVGQELPEWIAKRMNITLQQLIEADSPSALTGDVDHMCEQLLARRERLGVSYITAGDMFMDTLAPVIERLAGQ